MLYGIIGSIPSERTKEGLLIDIGSGNTKIGYAVTKPGNVDIVSIDVPFGSVTLSDAANTARGQGKTFQQSLERLVNDKVGPDLVKRVAEYPNLQRRTPVYVVGGAAWAMATLLHPENGDAYMKLTPAEIDEYYRRLVANADSATHPGLENVRDPKQRQRAASKIKAVNDTFTRENLLAGATLLKAVADQVRFDGREVYFSRFGGWLQGWVVLKGLTEFQASEKKNEKAEKSQASDRDLHGHRVRLGSEVKYCRKWA